MVAMVKLTAEKNLTNNIMKEHSTIKLLRSNGFIDLVNCGALTGGRGIGVDPDRAVGVDPVELNRHGNVDPDRQGPVDPITINKRVGVDPS